MRTSNIIMGISIFFSCAVIGGMVFYASPTQAMDTKKIKSCISCHEDVYKKDSNLFYLHPSFKNKKCKECHIKTRDKKEGESSRWMKLVSPELVSHSGYLLEHTLFLRKLDRDAVYDINIISRDMSGNQIITELRDVIPSRVSKVTTADQTPPVISGVKNSPVIKKIFLETVLSWDTDEPAAGYVEYGFSPQYGSRTILNDTLKRHHSVTLSKLERRKSYHYRVISSDIRGNQSTSKNFVFHTQETSSDDSSADAQKTESGTVTKLALRASELFVSDSILGLYIETTRPASVTVEYLKIRDAALSINSYSGQNNSSSGEKRKSHMPGFRSGKDLCIDLCYKCHPPDVLGVTHPVGVPPKKGTKIPEDLPTLEGSIITCVTCHNGHGGDLQYFARKRVSRELCNACHESY